MNPEIAIKAIKELPGASTALSKLSAEALERMPGGKAVGQMLTDLASHFPSLKVEYPSADQVMTEPIAGLRDRFNEQHQAILKALHPADSFLPHLGVHGTSAESGAKILSERNPLPLDFATSTTDGKFTDTKTYVSGIGKAMETATSFSEKWSRNSFGKTPGPIFVMDIGALDRQSAMNIPTRHPYSDGEVPELAVLIGAARQFKGTAYNIHDQNFSSVMLGTIDFASTRGSAGLVDSMNRAANLRLESGIPQDKVLPDLWQRGSIVEATRRLDLAHQAISKWLLNK